MYEYELGDVVTVSPHRDDPGGSGVVTSRSHTESEAGEVFRYRVLIEDSRYQAAVMKKSKRAQGRGLWYGVDRVSS